MKLNPYYTGILYTSGYSFEVWQNGDKNLILIILEYYIRVRSLFPIVDTWKELNPYYTGILYTRLSIHGRFVSTSLKLNPYYTGILYTRRI